MSFSFYLYIIIFLFTNNYTNSQIWKYIWINETRNFGWIFINETEITTTTILPPPPPLIKLTTKTTELPIITTTIIPSANDYNQLCPYCGHFETKKKLSSSTKKLPIGTNIVSSSTSSFEKSLKKQKVSISFMSQFYILLNKVFFSSNTYVGIVVNIGKIIIST